MRLLAEVGKCEAARRTGIPAGTIASWGHRNGVSSPDFEGKEQLLQPLRQSWEERRLRLKDKLGDAAERFIDLAIEERVLVDDKGRPVVGGANDSKNYMIAAAICVDKAQLLAGGATARTEVVPPTVIAELRDDLAARRAS